ncbi:hypothetical protein HDV05_002289 [Chytridiales sp. JEL 0842]|nr:hypothetical protein HDV05_002289 [Chytridiales sp. JEL 0842]
MGTDADHNKTDAADEPAVEVINIEPTTTTTAVTVEPLSSSQQSPSPKPTNTITPKDAHALSASDVRPISLQFQDITYTVLSNKPISDKSSAPESTDGSPQPPPAGGVDLKALFKKKPKVHLKLLEGVSGSAKPGEILAIMGPSGSGKSTLLDILAQRKGEPDSLSGQILLNGEALPARTNMSGSNSYSLGIGYVTQDDIFIETLTVRETMMIAAELKLSETIKRPAKEAIVEGILAELGLAHTKNTKVGGPLVPGISGGEKRRLSIAIELISSPSILMLDEPTSGLSSSDAFAVIKTVRELARKGRTVVLTIHQPRSEIFNLFDQVLLLTKGKVAYYGAVDNIANFFSTQGFDCPFGFNLADFMLDIVSATQTGRLLNDELICSYRKDTSPLPTQQQPCDLPKAFEAYKKVSLDLPPQSKSEFQVPASPTNEALAKPKPRGSYAASFHRQLSILLYRNFLHVLRHPAIFWGQLFIHALFGVITGSLFSDLKKSEAAAGGVAYATAGLVFWLSTFCAIMTFSAVPELILERVQYTREQAAGLYSPLAYFLAKVITETLFYSINVVSHISIVYYWVNLRPGASFFLYLLLIAVLFVNVSLASIAAIGAISDTVDVGMALVAMTNTFNLLFSGFLVNSSNMPPGWTWCYWSAHFQWGFTGMMLNEFGDDPSPSSVATLRYLGLESGREKWTCVYVLIGFVVAWRVLGYLFLLVKK